MNTLTAWRMRWERLGLPTIPIKPNSKEPLFDSSPRSWNTIPPVTQWQEAGADFRGNLGVIPGAGKACIDVDEYKTPGALANVTNWLEGLGLNPPLIMTPSGGARIWVSTATIPPDFNFANLSATIGAGELRARNCYTLEPCSSVDGKRYRFTRGQLEDIGSGRALAWADLAFLIVGQTSTNAMVAEIPVRLIRREMPTAAAAILEWLKAASKGQALGSYRSRSEAEAAAVTMLALSGWTFADVLDVFERWKPGHFREHGAGGEQYLELTWRKTLTHVLTTPERLQIAEAYQTAEASPWPGRSGALDKAVYMGLLSTAWQFGGLEVYASQRDLAEHAAASRRGVATALKRLQAAKLVVRLARRELTATTNTTVYRVSCLASLNTPPVTYGYFMHSPEVAELWTLAGLGRTAGLVFDVLNDTTQRAEELAALSGKCRRAVFNALRTLKAVGLAESTREGWTRAGDLEKTLTEFDAKARAGLRRARHKREREAFAELKRRCNS